VPLALLFGVEALSYRLANSGARALVMTTASAAKLAEIRPEQQGQGHGDGAELVDGDVQGGGLGHLGQENGDAVAAPDAVGGQQVGHAGGGRGGAR
jgi:hypothetical protein